MSMFKLSAIALAAIGLAGTALAQTSTQSGSQMQLSEAECRTVWQRINPAGAATATEAATTGYIQDFASVDTDSNGELSSTEFMTACQDGKVSQSASTGSDSGTSTTPKTQQ